MNSIIFVDRDGTIIREPRDKQIDSLEKLSFVPGIISGLKLLIDAGCKLVMVSNQDGLGTKRYPKEKFNLVQKKLLELLEGEGICFEKMFICPHRKEDLCSCRKPQIGLVRRYRRQIRFNKACSFVLGDRETDVQFAKNLDVRAVRLTHSSSTQAEYATPDASKACQYIFRQLRTASITRTTKETSIVASVTLESGGSSSIRTGIGFFDHMLDQLARHSGAQINLSVEGDLQIDEHHTVEDTGIVLGEALRQALGTKRGIQRFAFAAPLDEALATVVIDLSGRSFLAFDCSFKRQYVGELPTELVEDFFKAFADGLKATIHISCKGRNDHHKIESIFKATACALKNAIRRDTRSLAMLPSTKGML